MNIQDKINKLKTDHRLNISYSSIGECGMVAAATLYLNDNNIQKLINKHKANQAH